MKTVVVTGATSMIGAALIESCIEHNVEKIYAVVREGCSKLNRIPKDNRIHIAIFFITLIYTALPLKYSTTDSAASAMERLNSS